MRMVYTLAVDFPEEFAAELARHEACKGVDSGSDYERITNIS